MRPVVSDHLVQCDLEGYVVCSTVGLPYKAAVIVRQGRDVTG